MKKAKLIIPVVLLTASVACFAAACGETVPENHTHTFKSEWSYDEAYHWHASSCDHSDKTKDKETHTFTVTEVEPDCLHNGYTLHECACGYSYKTDEWGEALGHIIVHYDAKEATCGTDGWDAYSACARCGYEEGTHNVYHATNQHTLVHHSGQTPTHTEDGWEDYDICRICGYSTFKEVSSDTVHVYDGDTCTVCGYEYPLSQNLTFRESSSTCSVTGIGEYKGEELRIPKTHNGKTVTEIADGAFRNVDSITKVIIPGDVKRVGAEAFYGCDNLKEIKFTSEGTTTLGRSALNACAKLDTVTLPASMTKIEEFAFQNCKALATITLPEGLETLGFQSFYGCSALTAITIPEKIELIDYNTFMHCTSLSGVTFAGSKVRNIKWQAFYGCTSLTGITLPSSLSEIGMSCFEKSALTSVTLPASVSYIATGAFRGCALTSATFATTSGWKIAERDDIAEADLQDTAKAALYLKETHANEFWKRG